MLENIQEIINELHRMKKEYNAPQGCCVRTQERNGYRSKCLSIAIKALSEVQTLAQAKADGRLVERGTWINGYCSNCNSPIPTDNKDDYIAKNECRFCYYCGAKMEEAAEKALGGAEG
jgi:hypothetical protein